MRDATMMPASESYKITLQSQTVTFELRRSNRRSIGFRINSNGLQITAPHTMSLAQIKQAVTENPRGYYATYLGSNNAMLHKNKRGSNGKPMGNCLTWA